MYESPTQAPQYYANNPYIQPLPYYAPPPPPQPSPHPQSSPGQPMIIKINNNNTGGTFCSVCGSDTPTYPKRVIGAGNFMWCCICCLFFGPFGLIALCMDQFGDTQMRCSRCTGVKLVLPNQAF